MKLSEQVRQFIVNSEWDELSVFLEKHVEEMEVHLGASSSLSEEKIAEIKAQLVDIEALMHLVNEQKKAVEQQLISLKRSRVVSKLYLADDREV